MTSNVRNASYPLPRLQLQVWLALPNRTLAFEKSYNLLRQFAADIVSERGVGFMLDVANQFGDVGVQKLYNAVHNPEMSEKDVLEGIALGKNKAGRYGTSVTRRYS
jgi:hypothetical protein